MVGKAWDMFLGFLKEKPYWSAVQPFAILLTAYVAVEILAFLYIQSQYRFTPSVRLFVGSYVSVRITLVFLGIAVVLLLFKVQLERPRAVTVNKIVEFFHKHRRLIAYRAVVLCAAAYLVVVGFHYFSPHKVSHIRVKFMSEPEELDENFSPEAFAYLVYELNRLQQNWYLEVDFKPFSPAVLKSNQAKKCEEDEYTWLCYTEEYAKEKGISLIGITAESLDPAFFCTHRGRVSVITTTDRAYYRPLSTYEYLMYCLIVQSILIHLDLHGSGVPEKAFDPSFLSHGGVFQFTPRKETIKSVILAAKLSPKEEELLFNTFGPQYIRSCAELLTMEWFHSQRVKDNLRKF